MSNIDAGLLLVHVKRMGEAQVAQAAATAKLRASRKAAKADGISLRELDNVLGTLKLDQHELVDRHNTMVAYSKALNMPLAEQLSFLDVPEVSDDEVIARAFSDGLRAGKLGKSEADNPHDVTQPAGQKWLEGYRDGQSLLLMAIKEIDAKKTTDAQD